MAQSQTALDRILESVPEPRRSETDRSLRQLSGDPNDPIFILFCSILDEAERSRTAGINAMRADLKPMFVEQSKIICSLYQPRTFKRLILFKSISWIIAPIVIAGLFLVGLNYLSRKQLKAIAGFTRDTDAIAAFTRSLEETRKLNVTAQATAGGILALGALLNTPDIKINKVGNEYQISGPGLSVVKTDSGGCALTLRNNTLDDLVEMDLLRAKVTRAHETLEEAEQNRQRATENP